VLAGERRVRILERVANQESIEVAPLARHFAVSEMTIRRDIQRLERDGFLRRTYGGATAHVTRSFDLAFNARALQKSVEKRLIAIEAAKLAAGAQSLFLGIGTTAEQFARCLPSRPSLTVVTNSLPIGSFLGTRSMRVVLLGGNVRRDELSCVGPAAAGTLQRYHFELAVLGAARISARDGVTDVNDDEADVHRLAIANADRVMVIADGTKIGGVSMASVCPITDVDTLVTDASASAAALEAIKALGVHVVVATAAQREELSETSAELGSERNKGL
jgi:DeoR family transcriptional regulator of aga operon